MTPTIAELRVADEPDAWRRVGFAVADDLVPCGTTNIRLTGREGTTKIAGWALRDLAPGALARDRALDGLPTDPSGDPPYAPGAPQRNGVTRIDHVVAFSPSLARTVPALQEAGLDFRRQREGPTPAGAVRQAFFRLGEVILEVVEHPPGTPASKQPDAPARFWGLAMAVPDLEQTASYLGPLLGEVRPAIQDGRQIATLRREAGLALPVAFISD